MTCLRQFPWPSALHCFAAMSFQSSWLVRAAGLCYRCRNGSAAGNWPAAESHLLSGVSFPSPAVLLRVRWLRFLGQAVRSSPDHVWALISLNADYQQAVCEGGSWLHSIVGHTCALGSIDSDWFSWSVHEEPAWRWRGLL